jgi:hypothetical protein
MKSSWGWQIGYITKHFPAIVSNLRLLVSLIDLKYVDENLKSQPKHLWKYVPSFKKINFYSSQLEVDGKHLIKPTDIAGEFSRHLQSVYNSS